VLSAALLKRLTEGRNVTREVVLLDDGVWPDETKQIVLLSDLGRVRRARKCRRSRSGIPVFLLCEIRAVYERNPCEIWLSTSKQWVQDLDPCTELREPRAAGAPY
jgi:hypothetical protein